MSAEQTDFRRHGSRWFFVRTAGDFRRFGWWHQRSNWGGPQFVAIDLGRRRVGFYYDRGTFVIDPPGGGGVR